MTERKQQVGDLFLGFRRKYGHYAVNMETSQPLPPADICCKFCIALPMCHYKIKSNFIIPYNTHHDAVRHYANRMARIGIRRALKRISFLISVRGDKELNLKFIELKGSAKFRKMFNGAKNSANQGYA